MAQHEYETSFLPLSRAPPAVKDYEGLIQKYVQQIDVLGARLTAERGTGRRRPFKLLSWRMEPISSTHASSFTQPNTNAADHTLAQVTRRRDEIGGKQKVV